MLKKILPKALVAIIFAFLFATGLNNIAYASSTIERGLFTDSNNVRWEWERTINPVYTSEPERVSIMFYDKPESATSIVVPSLNDVLAAVPSATQTLDTYYLKNADEAYQAENYTSVEQSKRVSTANVTVLDMTNTSKIQIFGVEPIINPEVETELIFGENIVISDGIEVSKSLSARGCTGTYTYFTYSYNTGWHCDQTGTKTLEHIEENIEGWNDLNIYEKKELKVGIDDIDGLSDSIGYMSWGSMIEGEFDENKPYFFHTDFMLSTEVTGKGAFEGYKLKLTNLSNVKYLGWYAFKDSILSDSSRNITITANQTAGEGVFEGSNVTDVILEGDVVYPGMFRNCDDLASINFGNVETVGYRAFENSHVGDIDFSQTHIKNIQDEAFRNAGITAINLDGVERIGYRVFASNNIHDELYLPKSIVELGAGIFYGNTGIRKITVAYDTVSSGTTMILSTVLDGIPSCNSYAGIYCDQIISPLIEELVVLAPYEQDEEVKSSHMSYTDYRDSAEYKPSISLYNSEYGHTTSAAGLMQAENDYANTDSYKNLIAPQYFANLPALKSITVGDGYEYIGNGAFMQEWGTSGSTSWSEGVSYFMEHQDALSRVVLPESLKGVGSMAITYVFNDNFEMNLPSGIEFIGFAAFRQLFNWNIDLNLPNLKFLGDYAFYSTMVHDIELHNDLGYVGVGVFNDCPNLHDITFDYDVFGPDAFPWWFSGSTSGSVYRNFMGTRSNYFTYSDSVASRYGFDVSTHNGRDIKYGTITFTENAIHSPVYCTRGCYQSQTSFFYLMEAEKIDAGEAGWDVIPEYMFLGAYIGEVVLPKNLKTIRSQAFADAYINEEIILPNTLEVIEDSAFSQYLVKGNADTIKISSLPTSLKQIGTLAFAADENLSIETFDLPNLEVLGNVAFVGTSMENIVLRDSLATIGYGAFYSVFGIKNVIVDLDIFSDSITRSNNVMVGVYRSNFSRPYMTNDNIPNASFGKFFTSVVVGSDYWYYTDAEKHTFESVVFTGKSITSGTLTFYGFNIKSLDLSDTKWQQTGFDAFATSILGSVSLPSNLETVSYGSFWRAKIPTEVVLPDTIKVIESGAFINDSYANGVSSSQPGNEELYLAYKDYDFPIKITHLPTSLEVVQGGAFYGDYELKADLDLPNLKTLGFSAFMKTSLRNVTLHDSIESFDSSVFSCIPTLENITIDFDFYHYVSNFFNVFSTSPYDAYPGYGTYFSTESGYSVPYKNVVFTAKAVAEPRDTFAHLEFDKLDISKTGWDTIFSSWAFVKAKIGELLLPEDIEKIATGLLDHAEVSEPLSLPESVTEIEDYAFNQSKLTIANALPENVSSVGYAAFYGTDFADELVIPDSVSNIGMSAFNAGDTDVYYDTVTIKPSLDYAKTNNQAVFQMFWNAKMDKLVIESSMLPVLGTLQDTPILPDEVEVDGEMVSPLRFNGEPEFHAMTMREVVIKNLPQITANAFEDCANLEKVDLSGHDSLARISHHAFNNADKLKTFVFGDGLAGKNVALEEYAFRGTAIETMGDKNTDFALSAANFNAEDAAVFSEMPKLTTVYVPSTFTIQTNAANPELNTNGSTIPAYTFTNDPELKEVTLDYQLSKVDESAFLYDNKLEKLFVWGNTNINENDVELTIPEQTTIFAYSDAPAEAYANAESRNDYDGKFYALDEVLYLISNKSKVLLEQDEEGNNTGFDKTGLKLYGLRRDGVILEADWQNYNTAFKRTETPEGTNISFEEGRGALGPDDAAIAATVFDAPKPFNTISLANQNFANVDYEFLAMPSSENPLIIVHYPDGYTGNIRNTTLLSTTIEEIIEDITDPTPEPRPEDELEVPDTGSYGALIGAATSSVSIAMIIVLGGIFIAKRRKN